jgi:glycosyltransferase involved in cell wall biosynthesis
MEYPMAFLVAIPAYNEEEHVTRVIGEISCCVRDLLVVDDGSTDDTPAHLRALQRHIPNMHVLTHPANQGYGKSLIDIFNYAIEKGFEHVITLDCDEQHEPVDILNFVIEVGDWDIVSGSRYHPKSRCEGIPPPDERRRIGRIVCEEINRVTGFGLTDAFCGFKVYRTEALRGLHLTEHSYGMPIQFWIQAWKAGLSVRELPITLKYLDSQRTFGGELDNAETRLAYYRRIIRDELAKA